MCLIEASALLHQWIMIFNWLPSCFKSCAIFAIHDELSSAKNSCDKSRIEIFAQDPRVPLRNERLKSAYFAFCQESEMDSHFL